MRHSSRTYIQGIAFETEPLSLERSMEAKSYRPCTKVLMLNPRVGLTPVMSSSFSFFSIVVFPALSRPLPESHLYMDDSRRGMTYRNKSLISFSFSLFFRMIVSSPIGSQLLRAKTRSLGTGTKIMTDLIPDSDPAEARSHPTSHRYPLPPLHSNHGAKEQRKEG